MSQLITRGITNLAVTEAKLAASAVTNAKVSASAAIALSKLASGSSAQLIIANGSGVPTYVGVTGDIAITNAGVTSIGSGVIVNDDVNASAAIVLSKLAAVTASRALVSDGSGFVSASSVTSTELGYVSGVTSGIQAQLNALSSGYNRRSAVKDYIVNNTLVPPTEVSGDRYILAVNGGAPHANWDGASAGDIVEFNGSVWVKTTPSEGWITYDDDSNYDYLYVNDGTAVWEQRVVLTTSLADGKIWVGDSGGAAVAATMTGDIAISNTGVTSIASGVIVNDDINSSAAIVLSKLASGSSAQMIVANGSGVPAYVSITGDVSISNAGVTAIASGVIVDDDINSSAAIALSKLASITAGYLLVGPNGNGAPVAVAMSGDVTISDTGVTAIGSTKVTNGMLAGSIADSKLSTITTANKVSGSAVQIAAEASISDSTGLKGLKKKVEVVTLDGTDITNQYVDLASTPYTGTVTMNVKGLPHQIQGVDYTISSNRVTFSGDLATGQAAALIAADVVQFEYNYL